MREETALIRQKALFKRALCLATVREEWGKWRVSDMLDVKCALFRVMVAKYFSSCIPVISGTEGEEGGAERICGAKTGGRRIQTSWAHVRQRFCAWYMSPTEIRAGLQCRWCHCTEVCWDRIPQWHFKCNATVRQRPSASPWPKTTVTYGCIFCYRGNYFQRSNINHCTTYKQQDCTGFLERQKILKGYLKFTVKFILSSELSLMGTEILLNSAIVLHWIFSSDVKLA